MLGPEHPLVPTTQANLGITLLSQGKAEAAVAEYEEAIRLLERSVGEYHNTVGMARGGLASALGDLDRYEEAEAQHRRALAIHIEALGSDHPGVAGVRHNLSLNLAAQGKLGQAEEEERRACVGMEKTLGLEHPNTAEAQHSLASLVRRHQPTAALEYAERAWTTRRKDGVDPSERAATAFLLARILSATDQTPARAKTLAESAATAYRELGAEATEELATVEEWLATRG